MTRKKAVSFIRNTLGCQCPDEVPCAISMESWLKPDLVCHLLQEVNLDLSAPVLDVIVVGGKNEKSPGFKTTENLLNKNDDKVHFHSLGDLRG